MLRSLDDDGHRECVEDYRLEFLKLPDTLGTPLYPGILGHTNAWILEARNRIRRLGDQFVDAVLRPSTLSRYVAFAPYVLH